MSSYPPNWQDQQRVMREQARMQRDAWRQQARAQRDQYRMQRDQARMIARAGRRSSIVGPLLVIAIGVIFFLIQSGRIPHGTFWAWYAHWWPLLFVGAGVVMLCEWAFDRSTHADGVPYRRSIGGGVVFLMILMAVAGAGAMGARNFGYNNFWQNGFQINGDNWDQMIGDKHESDEPIVQAFPIGASFVVNNPRGDVTISGTSDDGQMHIQAHKEVYSSNNSDADQKLRDLSPNVNINGAGPGSTGSAGVVTVNVASQQGGHVDLVITLPGGTATTVNTDHGEVHANQLKAAVVVTSNHGDVEVSAITGSVTAHINNSGSSFSAHAVTGPVSIEGRAHDLTISDIVGPVRMTGDFFGDTHLEHINGTVVFHTSRTDFELARLNGQIEISHRDSLTAEEAVGPVLLTTSSRNITLDRIAGDVTVTNRNGSVDVLSAPPMGNLTVENRNGAVNITVPEKAGFNVQADTTNGTVQSDFMLNNQTERNRGSMSGTVGGGGHLVRLITSQGDITLRRNSLIPLPPLPPIPPMPTMGPHATPITMLPGDDTRRTIRDAQGQARDAAEQARVQTRKALEEARQQTREAAKQARDAAHQNKQ